MITEEELDKMVNSIKNSDLFLKEGMEEFDELKLKAEKNDILSEFLYGEQLYYNEKYLDSIYWISKAFFENKDVGRFYLNDLSNNAVKKLANDIVSIKKEGYGYELNNPINVVYVTGEIDYLKSITPIDGYPVTFNRIGSSSNNLGVMIDTYEMITISKYPNLQLQRFLIYLNM